MKLLHRFPRFAFAGLLVPVIGRAAESFLPTAGANCVSAGFCGVGATSLPSDGGIHGVSFSLSGSSVGAFFAEFSYGSNGTLQGADLPAGTVIPYHFRFTADSINAAGTGFQITSLVPEVNIGHLLMNPVVVIFDGRIGPGGGGPFGNHVQRILEGRGQWVLENGLHTDQTLHLGGKVSLQATAGLGTPQLTWNATFEFESVTPPKPVPVTVRIQRGAEQISLEWSAASALNFRVESTVDLPNWNPANGAILFTDGNYTWTGSALPETQFYRVVQLP